MSHVDDGELHAYLDGAIEVRGPMEEHFQVCPDCRNRLEAARADREGAGEILGLLGPDRVEAPPFEEILARRAGSRRSGEEVGGAGGSGGQPGGGVRGRSGGLFAGGPGPRNRLAWAATVVLALGSGWMARGALMPSPTLDAPDAGQEVLQLPGPVASREDPAAAPPPTVEAPLSPASSTPAAPAADQARVTVEPVVGAAEVAEAEALATYHRDEVAAEPLPPETITLETRGTGRPAADPAAPEAMALEAMAVERPVLRGIAPVPGAPVAEAVLARELRATREGSWRAASPAEAAHLLGQPPMELEGVPWARMEVAEVDGEALVRTIHPLAREGSVELIQGHRTEGAGQIHPGLLGRALLPTAGPGEPPVQAVAAERGGLVLVLRGTGDREALERLLQRVR